MSEENLVQVKKITIKVVCELGRMPTDEVKAHFLNLAKHNTEIAAIAGEVTGYGSRATQFGESFFLLGTFFAQNRGTGKLYEANKCYLPKDVTENIVNAFRNRLDASEHIEFKVIVQIVEDKSGATGYTYICKPIATPESITKRAKMMSTFLSLPAPEKKTVAKK